MNDFDNYTNTKDILKRFIKERFLSSASYELSDSDLLFEKDVIDSLDMLELINFIESSFGVVIDSSDVTTDSFSSIEKIANLIRNKLNRSG